MEFLEEFSLNTLQNICKEFKISLDGTKRQLILRLKDVPKGELIRVVHVMDGSNQNAVTSKNEQQKEQNVDDNELQNKNAVAVGDNEEVNSAMDIQSAVRNNQNVMAKFKENEETQISQKVQHNDKEMISDNSQRDKNQNDVTVLSASLKEKELELLKRENEMLRREREILRKENQMKLIDSSIEPSTNALSLQMISNLVADYDGKADGTFWVMQLRDIQQTYSLSDNMLRVLFATKLTGRAQAWLHARRNTSNENVDELLQQFCMTFGTKKTKLEIRRNFERRKWNYGENFADYFNDKIMLSSTLSLDEDELVEYIVDGIPSMHIRTQMAMQQYTSADDLLKTLANVRLSKPSQQTAAKNRGNGEGKQTPIKVDIRCYNCNSIGHYAADCGKPRRQPGTRYACGSDQHMVNNCEQNKKKTSGDNTNPYNV
ncbi:uncharacterized protein LOC142230328 isoform X2 [Haematobia irritans]|uniref:uncharacterized protein LOC142230328 isoform X2 n=1 Tax=Haematobia irritans TaxID=7368 RepID=UPI003F50613E